MRTFRELASVSIHHSMGIPRLPDPMPVPIPGAAWRAQTLAHEAPGPAGMRSCARSRGTGGRAAIPASCAQPGRHLSGLRTGTDHRRQHPRHRNVDPGHDPSQPGAVAPAAATPAVLVRSRMRPPALWHQRRSRRLLGDPERARRGLVPAGGFRVVPRGLADRGRWAAPAGAPARRPAAALLLERRGAICRASRTGARPRFLRGGAWARCLPESANGRTQRRSYAAAARRQQNRAEHSGERTGRLHVSIPPTADMRHSP